MFHRLIFFRLLDLTLKMAKIFLFRLHLSSNCLQIYENNFMAWENLAQFIWYLHKSSVFFPKKTAKTLSVSRKLLLLRADYYQEGSRMVGALRETLETLWAVGGLLAEPPALRRSTLVNKSVRWRRPLLIRRGSVRTKNQQTKWTL